MVFSNFILTAYIEDQRVLVLHACLTFFMTGLIWIVQRIHYPAYAFIEKDKRVAFQRFHRKRISQIVVPTMILEFLSGVYVAMMGFSSEPLVIVSLILLFVTWIATFLRLIPIHDKISLNSDLWDDLVAKLVKENWIRTICWSIRSLIFLYILLK